MEVTKKLPWLCVENGELSDENNAVVIVEAPDVQQVQ